MQIKYHHIGNTSLRTNALLYNFEKQLKLLSKLFENAAEGDTWANGSSLQQKYMQLLIDNGLLNTATEVKIGTKNARVKSSPLEDYGLVLRKEKKISDSGKNLLRLLDNKLYRVNNKFLEIDLVSFLFLQQSLKFSKGGHFIFKEFLDVFKYKEGSLTAKEYFYLPLSHYFENVADFVEKVQADTVIDFLFDNFFSTDINDFATDFIKHNSLIKYFKTAKGSSWAKEIEDFLFNIAIPIRQNSVGMEAIADIFTSKKHKQKLEIIKIFYSEIAYSSKRDERVKALYDFIKSANDEAFAIAFYKLVFKNRIISNLKDYADLNKRYLSLTSIFTFNPDRVDIIEHFKIILLHSKYKKIIEELAMCEVSERALFDYTADNEYLTILKNNFQLTSFADLEDYTEKKNISKIRELIENNFNKERLVELLQLFEDRANDKIIHEKVTEEATIPTIYEYIILIAFYYIDNKNANIILKAGLSLDNRFLPKSHASGGSADLEYNFSSHILLLEMTLTNKDNQRRAEMEPVTRHLGRVLCRADRYAYLIFIAPYLDNNVLNDFRAKHFLGYFEHEGKSVDIMDILPLSNRDIINILNANITYFALFEKAKLLISSTTQQGSKWYKNEVSAAFI